MEVNEILIENLRGFILTDLNVAVHYLQEYARDGKDDQYYRALQTISIMTSSLMLLHHGIISPEVRERYNVK